MGLPSSVPEVPTSLNNLTLEIDYALWHAATMYDCVTQNCRASVKTGDQALPEPC